MNSKAGPATAAQPGLNLADTMSILTRDESISLQSPPMTMRDARVTRGSGLGTRGFEESSTARFDSPISEFGIRKTVSDRNSLLNYLSSRPSRRAERDGEWRDLRGGPSIFNLQSSIFNLQSEIITIAVTVP